MDIGQRLKQARLAQGLSQRQLCGDTITRNMLSQIENGSARPSMDTLTVLAGRLGKPISYFLEEDAVCSPNQQVMADARKAFAEGNWRKSLEILDNYVPNDPVFDWEQGLLKAELLLNLSQQALRENRNGYAEHLLEQAAMAGSATPYYGEAHRQRWRLLLAKTGSEQGKKAAREISVDLELTTMGAALLSEDPAKAAQLLDCVQQKQSPRWLLLRGEAAVKLEDHAGAAGWLAGAEERFPEKAVPLLEQCYRELGDYKMAYEYACKQRK
jgi:transcriptional regulator with XRE-family HTH domain